MVFSSTVFLFVFFPFVIVIYYNPWIRNSRFRNAVLLMASIVFYAWGEPVFVILMLISIIVTWGFGLLINRYRNREKQILTLAITWHVMILFVFKYLPFFVSQIDYFFLHEGLQLRIVLPIGISFFTFQMMSYLFDVYYEKTSVQKNLASLALYVSLFPQLIAGPIVRYNQIEREITDRNATFEDFTIGMERFIYGLAKKVLLSNYLAYIADTVFDANERSVATAWLGGICYTLQIFFDFSGYSDMAIGMGRIFGFHFTENFDYPYISRSFTEFWRRWHISLGTWFRDYVYIPLGGNRVSERRWVFNVFVVWLLTGIWHGANWTFMIWGLLCFAILMTEKLTGVTNKMGAFSRVYALIVIIISWVVFRADTIADAMVYLGNMVGIGGIGWGDAVFFKLLGMAFPVLIVSCVLSTPVYKILLSRIRGISQKMEDGLRSVICLTLFALSVIETVASSYNPFIYFNF